MFLGKETLLKALSYAPQHAPQSICNKQVNQIKMFIIYTYLFLCALSFDTLIARGNKPIKIYVFYQERCLWKVRK